MYIEQQTMDPEMSIQQPSVNPQPTKNKTPQRIINNVLAYQKRMADDEKWKEKRVSYNRRYYLKNKERLAEKARERYHENLNLQN